MPIRSDVDFSPGELEISYNKVPSKKNNASTKYYFDPQEIKKSTEKVKSAGFHELASILDSTTDARMNNGGKISFSDLAASFSSGLHYTWAGDLWKHGSKTNPYYEFSNFLYNGKAYMQCSGSNSYFVKFLKNYTERLHPDRFDIEIINGLTKKSDYISATGHRITMIYDHLQKKPYYVDATASLPDQREEEIIARLKKIRERHLFDTTLPSPSKPSPSETINQKIRRAREKINTVGELEELESKRQKIMIELIEFLEEIRPSDRALQDSPAKMINQIIKELISLELGEISKEESRLQDLLPKGNSLREQLQNLEKRSYQMIAFAEEEISRKTMPTKSPHLYMTELKYRESVRQLFSLLMNFKWKENSSLSVQETKPHSSTRSCKSIFSL